MSRPDPDRLDEIAVGQAGCFTTRQAAEAGYSRPLLDHHVRAGWFRRLRRGVHQLVHFPSEEDEDLVVAWLWSDRTVVASHETALALHGLSEALPARIHLTVPASWARRRLTVPPAYILIDPPPRGGEGRLGGRPYGDRLGVDVVLGEPMVDIPDLLASSDILAFIGIERPRFPTVPVAAHVAEKFHAHTLPRPRPNSRVKDLPDLAQVTAAARSFLDPVLAPRWHHGRTRSSRSSRWRAFGSRPSRPECG